MSSGILRRPAKSLPPEETSTGKNHTKGAEVREGHKGFEGSRIRALRAKPLQNSSGVTNFFRGANIGF